jgi:polyphosphate kinase 2 (PPK2 family)
MTHLSLTSLEAQTKAKKSFKDKTQYETELKKYQKLLLKLQHEIHASGKKVILVFEGTDASGKGGAIKRLTENLEPTLFAVHAIKKPTSEEFNEHYMERFWRKLPKKGMMTIFDRSWYGRVLVEKVEKFCPEDAWKRAYQEINNFEKMLTDDGYILIKFLLDITYEEQANRFQERKTNPLKTWKLSNEDFRNRQKWDEYYIAFTEMLKKTNAKNAPWILIPADSKWWARIEVIKNVYARCKN